MSNYNSIKGFTAAQMKNLTNAMNPNKGFGLTVKEQLVNCF